MFNWDWIITAPMPLLMVLLSAVGIFVAVIVFTRLAGLRSFSKMSSFDFAMTVAIGSVIATTVTTPSPPLLQAVFALGCLYALQKVVALLRERTRWMNRLVDNQPVLLMVGSEMIAENLRRTEVTEEDVWAKLREANVLRPEQVQAVVLETTGDISVLHGTEVPLDPVLLTGVFGRDRVEAATGGGEKAA